MNDSLIHKDTVIKEFFWLWPLFCLQAGLINSGGFLACQSFVSHVTGFGTRIGIEFIQANLLLGLEMLLIPFGFILGCATAGYFREIKKLTQIPFWLMSFLLAMVWFLGANGMFGSFGEELLLQRDFFLLFLLCFSCGLQNGILASLTGGVVRTTHMTGIATDIGLAIPRILCEKSQMEKTWLKLRVHKFIFFAAGAALGTMLFSQIQFTGFLIAAIMNVALFLALRYKAENKEFLVPETVS